MARHFPIPPDGAVVHYYNDTTRENIWGYAKRGCFIVLSSNKTTWKVGKGWAMADTLSSNWTRRIVPPEEWTDELCVAVAKYQMEAG